MPKTSKVPWTVSTKVNSCKCKKTATWSITSSSLIWLTISSSINTIWLSFSCFWTRKPRLCNVWPLFKRRPQSLAFRKASLNWLASLKTLIMRLRRILSKFSQQKTDFARFSKEFLMWARRMALSWSSNSLFAYLSLSLTVNFKFKCCRNL